MAEENQKKIENDKPFFEEFKILLDKHGIPDYFFTGIRLNGSMLSDYKAGSEKTKVSNADRFVKLSGLIEETKFRYSSEIYDQIDDSE